MGTSRKLYLVTTKTFSATFFLTQLCKLSSTIKLKHWHTLFWYAPISKVETAWANVYQVDLKSVYRCFSYLIVIIYLSLGRLWYRQRSILLTIPCIIKSGRLAVFDIIKNHSLLLYLYPYHSHIKVKYSIERKTHILFQMT